jgi:hypothetical protein
MLSLWLAFTPGEIRKHGSYVVEYVTLLSD